MSLILALDLARDCGWCLIRPQSNGIVACGTWVLPHIGGEGARFASFENELANAITFHQPTHLCVEAPLPLEAQNSRAVAFQQFGLRAFAASEAYRASIPYHEQDVYTVRREVLGTGRFAKGQVKHVVFKWAKGQGFNPPDHNAADACVLGVFYARRLT